MEDRECQAELQGSTTHLLPADNDDESYADRSKLLTSCGPLSVALRRASSAPRHFMSTRDAQKLRHDFQKLFETGSYKGMNNDLQNTELVDDKWQQPATKVDKLLTCIHRSPSVTMTRATKQQQQQPYWTEKQCSSSSTESPFRDPLLEELDAELPIPPPPPKAIPFWLKMSLDKQYHKLLKNNQLPMSQSLTPPTSPSSDLDEVIKRNSKSLGHDDVRICPIMQNGVKMSDTHYWLLQPPSAYRYPSTIARAHSERVPPPTPTDFVPSKHYLNLQSPVKLRRGHSDSQRNQCNSMHREKINRLLAEIPSATEAECQAILIGCGYNYAEAVKKLKLELLYRQGYASRSRCSRLLSKNQWSLEEATKEARREYEVHNPNYNFQQPSSTHHLRDQIFTFSEELSDTEIHE